MRFLARDQVSNVLASRGPRYRLVCRATASREKKHDPSFRATDGLREAKFYFLFAKKTTLSRTVTRDTDTSQLCVWSPVVVRSSCKFPSDAIKTIDARATSLSGGL